MKPENTHSKRSRLAAAICAVVILAGGSAGMLALHSKTHAQSAAGEETVTAAAKSADDGIISAGGTITSTQLSDSLGLESSAVRLTVEEVLVEAGETVTAGTPLYTITSDSLAKAEKTLDSELQTAKSSLLKQELSYQTDKNSAYLLYQSELMLGSTAQQEYDSSMASLDSSLNKAYEAYQEAVDTISSTPAEISAKQSQLSEKQTAVSSLEAKKSSAQSEADNAKAKYTSAAEKYNSLVSEYNAAAGTVRYLGNALGRDVSDIELVSSISSTLKEQTAPSAEKTPSSDRTPSPDKVPSDQDASRPDGQSFDMTDFKMPSSIGSDIEINTSKKPESGADILTALYESALREYNTQKEQLRQAESEYTSAEQEYDQLSESLSKYSSDLNAAQSEVSALEKEISSLNSTLSKAKSNLSKLLSEYNSLSASYQTDQLELKNKLDTDNASYENAEYHYQITLSTIEEDLAKAQAAYDTAEENLRIFNEELSDGKIYAKQDGVIYSMNCQEGRSISISSPVVSYVDKTGFSTVVELDQNDVTQVSIGDTVIIYSSESGMTNGKITAIAEGTSTSLADVRFNVTVAADENASLYVGQSVNVYFNYSDMRTSDFADFKGSSSGSEKTGSDSSRPSFGGSMPEGFDPSNMPDFSRRKED